MITLMQTDAAFHTESMRHQLNWPSLSSDLALWGSSPLGLRGSGWQQLLSWQRCRVSSARATQQTLLQSPPAEAQHSEMFRVLAVNWASLGTRAAKMMWWFQSVLTETPPSSLRPKNSTMQAFWCGLNHQRSFPCAWRIIRLKIQRFKSHMNYRIKCLQPPASGKPLQQITTHSPCSANKAHIIRAAGSNPFINAADADHFFS